MYLKVIKQPCDGERRKVFIYDYFRMSQHTYPDYSDAEEEIGLMIVRVNGCLIIC